MMKNLFYILTICILVVSCQSQESVETPIPEEVVIVETPTESYEGLPIEHIEKLYAHCNLIEATFYQTSQSMSTESVKDFLNMFNLAAVPTSLNQQDNGHILFLDSGNQILLGKISLSASANYIYFEVEGKKYYNTIQEGSLPFIQGIALRKE